MGRFVIGRPPIRGAGRAAPCPPDSGRAVRGARSPAPRGQSGSRPPATRAASMHPAAGPGGGAGTDAGPGLPLGAGWTLHGTERMAGGGLCSTAGAMLEIFWKKIAKSD